MSKLVIFGNFILIATGKPNKLQKINYHVEKEDIISFLQIVVDFLLHIWFTHGDQNNIGKNCQFWFSLSFTSKLVIFGNFVLIGMGELNMLQKIYKHLKTAVNVFFLHMVVDFL